LNFLPVSIVWRNFQLSHSILSTRELGIGIVPYSPVGRGLFAGKAVIESLPANSFLVRKQTVVYFTFKFFDVSLLLLILLFFVLNPFFMLLWFWIRLLSIRLHNLGLPDKTLKRTNLYIFVWKE